LGQGRALIIALGAKKIGTFRWLSFAVSIDESRHN
jgi:hypothetical protein